MKKIPPRLTSLLLSCFSLFIVTNIKAQISTTFMRIATAPGMNGGLSLAETSDGGFVGAGQQQAGSAGGCDVYVYKVNGCGYLQWEKLYGNYGDDGGKYVMQTSDGGYIVASLYNTNYSIMLLKLDGSGNLQWTNVYDLGYGLFVQETSDGGFVLSGFLQSGVFGLNDIVIIKTDANGVTLWEKAYGGAADEWGSYVQQTSDGGYIVAGYTTSYGAGSSDLFLLKLDNSGTILWNKTYGGSGGEGSSSWGISGQETADGGYMVCANTTSYGAGSNDVLLIKTDNNGNVQWAKTYGGSLDDQPRCAHQISDKGYIICGYTTTFGHGDLDAYLVKTDSLGNLLWSKAYGATAYDKAQMVRETSNKGFAVSMISLNYGADYYDPIFMKTDSVGFVGCGEIGCGTLVNNVSPIVSSGLNQNSLAINVSHPALSTNNYSATDSLICLHCGIIPTFTTSTSTACIGNTVYYYNTTNPGAECTEWFVNGISQGVQDTLAIVFSSPGVQQIQLVASCGNSTDTNTVAVNILAHNAPVASFAHNTVCNGDSTVFIDNSTSSSGPINSWSWDYGNNSPFGTVQHPSYIYSLPGTYNVILTVTTTDGCTDTAMSSVVIHPLPNIQFDSIVVCRADTIQFNNSTTILPPDNLQSWAWDFGDNSTINTTQNPYHVYSTPGTYTVKLIATSNNGCKDSLSRFITATSVFAIDAAFGSNTLCTGGTVLLGGAPTATGGFGPYTYSWAPSIGLSGSTTANPTATVTSNTTYTLTVTTTDGCVLTDTVLVTYTSGNVHAVAGFGTNNICTGGNVLLGGNPTASGGVNPYAYLWQPTAGLNDTSLANPTATISSNTVYIITVTDSIGCQDIDSVFLFYNSIGPHADAGFGNNQLCTGGTIVLGGTPTGTGGTPPYTYSWVPITGINNPTAANPAATIANDTTFVVIVIDSVGCQNLDSVSILYNSNGPFANAGFGSNNICTGGTVLLGGSPTATGGIFPYIYLWIPSNGLSDTSSANPTATIISDTTYVLIIKDSLGCENIDSVHITYSANGPHAEAGFGNDSLCTGGTILLGGAPTATGGIMPYSYFWLPFSNLSNTAIANPTATISSNASYVLTVVDSTGCQDIDSVFIFYSNSGPYADAGFGHDTLCTSGTILLGGNPTATAGVSPYTYEWLPVTGLNSNTIANPAAVITGNTFYTVILMDASGCENLDTVLVNYNPNAVHADAGFNNSNPCTGGNIILGGNPTATNGIPPYIYLWIPTSGLNNSALPNPTATITTNSTYAVLVTDGYGCQDLDSAAIIYNATGPYANAGLGDGSLCYGRNFTLGGIPTAYGGTEPYLYFWTPSTYINDSSISNPTAVNVISNQTYYITVVDASGCSNIDSTNVSIIGTGLTANFSADPIFGYEELTVNFIDSSSGQGLTYFWNFGDGGTSTEMNPSHTFVNISDTAIHYQIILITTDIYGCSDTAIYNSLIDLEGSSSFTFTNVFTPNGDGVNDLFSFNFKNMEFIEVSVFNRWGQKIWAAGAPNSSWDGRSASGVPVSDGTYYYMIKAKGFDGVSFDKAGYIQLIR